MARHREKGGDSGDLEEHWIRCGRGLRRVRGARLRSVGADIAIASEQFAHCDCSRWQHSFERILLELAMGKSPTFARNAPPIRA